MTRLKTIGLALVGFFGLNVGLAQDQASVDKKRS